VGAVAKNTYTHHNCISIFLSNEAEKGVPFGSAGMVCITFSEFPNHPARLAGSGPLLMKTGRKNKWIYCFRWNWE